MSSNPSLNELLRQQFQASLECLHGPRWHRVWQLLPRLIAFKIIYFLSEKLNLAIRGTAVTFWGETMTVVVRAPTAPEIYKYSILDEDLIEILLAHLKPNMIFFDIGAHFGYFTLLASKIVGTTGQVHAFEPTPSTFEILQTNVKNRSNIHANNLAIWSKPMTLTLNDYGFMGSAFNSLYASRLDEAIKKHLPHHQHQVQAVTIDDYVQQSGAIPNFIKIDAEIAEYEILQGMRTTIAKHHPLLMVEVGDENTAGETITDSVSSHQLVRYLLDAGYMVFEIHQREISPHTLLDHYPNMNLLFMRAPQHA